jgi:hypothetical protein
MLSWFKWCFALIVIILIGLHYFAHVTPDAV